MIKIMMHGCNGKMGRMITEIVKNDENAVITAGVDTYTETPNDYPVFDSVEKCTEDADVVIVDKKLPVVLCTTGLSEEQLAKAEKAAEKTAVLKSANMSLGINLLLKLLKDAAKVLAPAGYDIELVEKQHNQKLGNEYHYVYDRSTVRQKRDAKEIGISALRGGTIVGEHEVIFAGTDEVIEFKHTAYSRSVFGKGAVEAAKFLAGKESGMYDMSDVVGL